MTLSTIQQSGNQFTLIRDFSRQILNLLNDKKLLYQQLNYYHRFPIFQWIMGYDHNKEKMFSYKSSIPQKDDVQLRDVKLQFEWSKLKLEFEST